MAVNKRLRFEILKRDNFTCQYCGAKSPQVVLQVDHIVPKALGGSDKPSNLATACRACNYGKASANPDDPTVEAPTLDAARWRRAIEEVGATFREGRVEQDRARDAFKSRWTHWLPDDWGDEVDGFVRMGLAAEDIGHITERSIERTTGPNHAWNYFRKVCRNEIYAIRDAAAEKVAGAPAEPAAYECGYCGVAITDADLIAYLEQRPDSTGFCSVEHKTAWEEAARPPEEAPADPVGDDTAVSFTCEFCENPVTDPARVTHYLHFPAQPPTCSDKCLDDLYLYEMERRQAAADRASWGDQIRGIAYCIECDERPATEHGMCNQCLHNLYGGLA